MAISGHQLLMGRIGSGVVDPAENEVVAFDGRLVGEVRSTAASSVLVGPTGPTQFPYWGRTLAVADVVPGDPPELLVAGQNTSTNTLQAFHLPLEVGVHPSAGTELASYNVRNVVNDQLLSFGDWDGDGVTDVAWSWFDGQAWDGQQIPPAPYPLGGFAVYRGPVADGTRVLVDPPYALIDPTGADVYPASIHSGGESVFVFKAHPRTRL
jgi:hypothetical protein